MSLRSRLGRRVDVVLRADEPVLLSAPEGEPHAVHGLDPELRHLQRGLEDRGRAGPVVVDPRAFAHGVEVGADDDSAVDAAGRRVGDDVGRCSRLDLGVHGNPHRDRLPARDPVVELLSDREGRPDDREVVLRRVERPGDDAESIVGRVVVPLVEDDHRDGARGLRGLGLLAEGAGAALDERDRARREAGVVGRGAAAGRAAGRGDRDATRERKRRREVPGPGVVHGRVLGVQALGVRLRVRRDALEGARVEDELVIGEVLDRDVVPRVGQQTGDVVDGCRVARRARGAGASVGIGDGLERLFVLHDAGDRDRVTQSGRVGPDRGRTERRQGQRHYSCCEQQESPLQEMPPCLCECATGRS